MVTAQDNDIKFTASHRYARISPRKARFVVDMIRDVPIQEALRILKFNPRRAATFVEKIVRSAIANAEYLITERSLEIDLDSLYVSEARVDEGPTIKRWRPRSRGMAHPVKKRTSHISIALAPDNED